MPSLADHHSNTYVKLLLLGDAKSGKTTSLASLVAAGYKLRILDMDNLLDPLRYRILKLCPDKINNVEYRSVRDQYKPSPAGTMIDGRPKAWIESIKMLNKWAYTDEETGEVIDLGSPWTWEPDCILVIDSLSRWCDAALDFHEVMTPKGKSSGEADGRAVYWNAQIDVEKQLAMLTNKKLTLNVIVICHGVYQTLPDGTTKIFPQGVGAKLSPKIPTYFPNYIRYINRGEKRSIQLHSDMMISLANANPDAMPTELSTDDLHKFFAVLREPPTKIGDEQLSSGAAAARPRPKSLTLMRR